MLKSLSTSLTILKAFTSEEPEWGGRELARELGLTQSTVYRALKTFEANGFLRLDPVTKRYRLSLVLWEMGLQAYRSLNITELIQPKLEQLCTKLSESVHFTVLDEDEALLLAAAQPTNKAVYSVNIGSRSPLYPGASYRAILAFMPEGFVEEVLAGELKAFTGNTMTSPAALREELKLVRAQGWAMSESEQTLDIRALAMPVFRGSTVVGSVTVSGPSFRLSNRKLQGFVGPLRETALALTGMVTRYQIAF